MTAMQIVDAQVHIWDHHATKPGPRSAKPAVPKTVPCPKDIPFTKDDLLAEMDCAGVAAAIIVPNSEGPGNALALAAAGAHPDRFGVMGILDLEDPASRGRMAAWREQPGMLGIRFNLRKAQFRPLLTEGRQDWIWGEAEAARVPVMFLARHHDLHYIADVARKYPALKLTLDHMGFERADRGNEHAFDLFGELMKLGALPNVAVKVSAIPLFATDPYPFRSFHPYLRRIYDAFGPHRMFWGTDMTRLSCTYRQTVTLFTEEMPWLSEEDKQWIMGRGLSEWLRWERRLP